MQASRVQASRVQASRVLEKRVLEKRVLARRVLARRVQARRVQERRVQARRVQARRVLARRVLARRVQASRVQAKRVQEVRRRVEKRERRRISLRLVSLERRQAPRGAVVGRAAMQRRRLLQMRRGPPHPRKQSGAIRIFPMPAMPPVWLSSTCATQWKTIAPMCLINSVGRAIRPGRFSSGGRRCSRWPAAAILCNAVSLSGRCAAWGCGQGE